MEGAMKVINEKLWDLINSIAPVNSFITGIFPDKAAEILYENGYRSTDGEKIKNEFPVEDRLDGIVEALKELEEREDE